MTTKISRTSTPDVSTDTAATSTAKTSVPSYFPGRQWQQVLERDSSADGQFFYAVKSTKIYCKPSCPSRKPARKQVSFYPTAAAAEAAGFRACLRCEPDRVIRKPDPQADAITAVTDYLTTHAAERTRLADVAKATGVGRLTILRGFKRVLGVSPGEFAKAQRLERFKENVRVPKTNVPNAPLPQSAAPAVKAVRPTKAVKPTKITDAIYAAGFGSSSRLYEKSGASLGMTPRVMRAGGEGLLIKYTTAASPLGRMLVATTDVGICSISFGKDDTALVAEVRENFNKAQLVSARGNTGWLHEAVTFVVSQLSEHPAAAKFPLDVRATAFQQRVWKALQQIPRGETRSYGELALELGVPKSARAIGAAVGANPVAVVVPCHRVIGQDGAMTGYRWGVERKRKLLDAERP